MIYFLRRTPLGTLSIRDELIKNVGRLVFFFYQNPGTTVIGLPPFGYRFRTIHIVYFERTENEVTAFKRAVRKLNFTSNRGKFFDITRDWRWTDEGPPVVYGPTCSSCTAFRRRSYETFLVTKKFPYGNVAGRRFRLFRARNQDHFPRPFREDVRPKIAPTTVFGIRFYDVRDRPGRITDRTNENNPVDTDYYPRETLF